MDLGVDGESSKIQESVFAAGDDVSGMVHQYQVVWGDEREMQSFSL